MFFNARTSLRTWRYGPTLGGAGDWLCGCAAGGRPSTCGGHWSWVHETNCRVFACYVCLRICMSVCLHICAKALACKFALYGCGERCPYALCLCTDLRYCLRSDMLMLINSINSTQQLNSCGTCGSYTSGCPARSHRTSAALPIAVRLLAPLHLLLRWIVLSRCSAPSACSCDLGWLIRVTGGDKMRRFT